MNTIYWHDYETTGVDPAMDRPSQFAGIRTDEDLNIIGEPLSLYCQPATDCLPHPRACLVTGITPQLQAREGVPEPEFIGKILAELAQPGTCGAGYNSIRFDDEVTRYTLYRNFHDPYEREWKNGNSRWDIIDMLRLTRALRPSGIQWPDKEDGGPSFRLEELTAANGIAHESAHDALSDVRATIAMAKLVKQHQPRLYNYVYEHRLKYRVAELLDVKIRKPVLHVSSRLPRANGYLALMVPLLQHPVNKNAVIAFNLMGDPEMLKSLDAGAIRERLFTSAAELPEDVERIPLKAIHLNRCPVVATPKLLTEADARRLGIDLQKCERHWQRLKDWDDGGKLTEVFAPPAEFPARDVEASLYSGFLPDPDRQLLNEVRTADAETLGSGTFAFTDARYGELLFRYRARNFPDSLNEEEQHRWEEFRYRRLTDPELGCLTLDDYHSELDKLAGDTGLSSRDRQVLEDLRDWGDQLL